jgi:hypothetical protein
MDDRKTKNPGAMIDNKPAESRAILESLCSNAYSRTIHFLMQQVTAKSFEEAEQALTGPANEIQFLDAPGWDGIPGVMHALPHLMYNFCEEKLHASFFHQVFAGELKRYTAEAVSLPTLRRSGAAAGYPTNLSHCEMMERQPGGVLNLFEESSMALRINDKDAVDKLMANHAERGKTVPAGKPTYVSGAGAKAKATAFVIRHSFGEVHYDSEGFALMNKSCYRLTAAAEAVLAKSEVAFIAEDYAQTRKDTHPMVQGIAAAKAAVAAGQTKSVVGLFPSVDSGAAAARCCFCYCMRAAPSAAGGMFGAALYLTSISMIVSS